ncbi:sulfite exporter TauE/SafE family protein [Lutispora thermophila]|uniref:Probable membrane transporter protein n=1 Tax=Lutispora thermophila DSM 19022 TaxID=1122184 RepID=A0A1M6HQ83_9FIRM|nr:sulfite exporter TauE/SafE family protein [Lutispora thermophila]SHJ24402.1 hypothetical protein SAMN02745176_02894 [Lutispora thermophila DSM 19022]
MNLKSKTSLWIIGFIAGIFNGLCGSGGGTILVPSLVFFTKVKDHNAHATAIAVILPLTIISSLIYAKSGIININTTFKVTIGTVIGAYIGSKLLNRLSISILRKLFGIFMIIAAIRMIIR